MHIAWAVACSGVAHLGGGVATIEEAGLDTMLVEDIPADVAFTVAMMIAAPEVEVGETFEIDGAILGPGNPLLVAELQFEIAIDEPGEYHPNGYLVTDIHSFDVVFQADSEGMYSLELDQPGSPDGPPDAVRGCPVFLYVRLTDEARSRIADTLAG